MRGEILHELGKMVISGNKAEAKNLFFDQILPSPEFSNSEYLRIGAKVGAFDEGEEWTQLDEAYVRVPDPLPTSQVSSEVSKTDVVK